jgi:DNA modification methylase
MDAIVAVDDSELRELEATIERGVATFVEVGAALTRIRDGRLYLRGGYRTFEHYLRDRWDMARRSGYDYIYAAEVSANVRPAAHELPSLRHAAMLHGLPIQQQLELAAEVVERHGTIKWLRRRIVEKQRLQPDRAARVIDACAPGELDQRIRIEVGDARRLPLADNSAHLVVTSPPYNCRLSYDGYADWLPWDDYWHGLIEPALREVYRVLAPGGRLCLNMPNVIRQNVPQPGHSGRATQYQSRGRWKYKPPGADGDSWSVIVIPRVWALLEDIGFLPREHLTWCKGQEGGDGFITALTSTSTAWGTFASASNPVLRAVAEPVFVASKGTHSREPGPSDLSADEFKRLSKNVWFVPALTPDLDHPSMFPEELPQRLLKLYGYRGDLVVDPFLGSGTTAVAAARLERRFYGCDISSRYVAMARTRVARSLAEEAVA